MKKLFITSLLSLLISINIFAQCMPDAGPDDSACGYGQYTFNGTLGDVNSTCTWTTNCPSYNFANPNDPNTDVIVPWNGTWEFYLTENNSIIPCSETDTVIISFLDLPNIDAGIDQTVCGNWFQLNATSDGYTGQWVGVSGALWATSPNLIDTNYLQQFEPNTWVYYPTLNSTILPAWLECNVICCSIDSVSVSLEENMYVYGNVLYNANPLNTGDAEIELYNTATSIYELSDISSINGSGLFYLQGNISSNYLIKANVLNQGAYPDALNSYYNSEYLWGNAQILSLSCGDSVNVDINLEQTTTFTPGIGNVSGIITNENTSNPVPDVTFFIEDTLINHPYLSITSDLSGYYEFDNLPNGAYKILVDIPGIPQVTIHNFTVTALDTLFENYDFYVDTVLFKAAGIGIYADSSAIVNISNPINVSLLSVYPNPFQDKINLEYTLEQNSIVEIQLIDINGKVIQKQAASRLNSGSHSETLNITNKGVYFVVVSINNKTYIKKIVSE